MKHLLMLLIVCAGLLALGTTIGVQTVSAIVDAQPPHVPARVLYHLATD